MFRVLKIYERYQTAEVWQDVEGDKIVFDTKSGVGLCLRHHSSFSCAM